MSDTLISVDRVSKKFCRSLRRSLWYGVIDLGKEVTGRRHGGDGSLRQDEFWAVKDISFELKRGECLGIIGRNGAGKTTLLRMLNGLVKPDSGRIEMRGRVGALIALGAGFNPILTGRENVYVAASVLGMSRKQIDARFDDIVEFAELGDFIDAPVQSYSSGMHVRLGFSVATALEPDVLLLDEVLAVGDASFRSKCVKRIGVMLERCAVIFVSHDAWPVRRICDSVIWLQHGLSMFHGDTSAGMEKYVESSAGREQPALLINTDESISNVKHHAVIHRRLVGEEGEVVDIDVTLEWDATRAHGVGYCLGNVSTPDEVVIGQFDLEPLIKGICSGHNVLQFRISDLRLARGTYWITIGLYDESSKQLLVNVRNFARVDVSGNVRHGVHYAVVAEPLPHPAVGNGGVNTMRGVS